MTQAKIYPQSRINVEPGITIGPRLAVEIRKRVRELEQRLPAAMTSADRSELRKLKSMLELLSTVPGGGND